MSMTRSGNPLDLELARLLTEILADLEMAMSRARNKPARKLLHDRIGRLRRAIELTSPGDALKPAAPGRPAAAGLRT